MALDQNPSPAAPDSAPASVIENELPTYRAISPTAVISMIFGVLSVLSFADWMFLSCAGLAIVLGVLADRKIRRYPDVLTGRNIAQAGIALGLVFGLSAVTTGTVQSLLRRRSAASFARMYVEVLRGGKLENAFWYTRPVELRKQKSPGEMYKDFKIEVHDPLVLQAQTGEMQEILRRLSSGPNETIRFSKIEADGDEGSYVFATALLDLDGPPNKVFPKPEEFALLTLKAEARKGKFDWWVAEVKFPYEPSTFVPQPEPDPHGHGHAH